MNKCGVAWFKMNEESGNILDSKGGLVGTAYNLTYQGEEGIYFNGNNSYIQFSNKVIPMGKKSIYFEIKTSQTNASIVMTQSKGSLEYGTQIAFLSDNSGKIYLTVNRSVVGSSLFNLITNKVIADDLWHKILFTWDGTTNENGVKLYVDNMDVPQITATSLALETTTPTNNLSIGRGYATDNRYYYNGYLRNIQIYSDVIDPNPNIPIYLIHDNNVIKTIKDSQIITIGEGVPTEEMFLEHGFTDVKELVTDEGSVEFEMASEGVLGEGEVFKFTIPNSIKSVGNIAIEKKI